MSPKQRNAPFLFPYLVLHTSRQMCIPHFLRPQMNIPITLQTSHTKPQPPPKDLNLLIKHHANLKNDHAILSTYTHMASLSLPPSPSSLSLILKACARLGALHTGRSIHNSLIRNNSGLHKDVRINTALVDFYSKCGLLRDALDVFDGMRERDLVAWNALIHGCVGCGCYEEAVELFREIMIMGSEGLRPNSRSLVAVVLACKEIVFGVGVAKEVHCFGLRNGLLLVEGDAHLVTALIGFYARFDVGIARGLFDEMVARGVVNVVSLNTMIQGYFDAGECLAALEVFVGFLVEGVRFDSVTMLVVVQACGKIGDFELAVQIHQMCVKLGYSSDVFIVNVLLNMYNECGCFELSRVLFETVPKRDVALWNSLLAAYCEYGLYDEAVSLFLRLRKEGGMENERTVYIMLSLCEEISDGVREGKGLHALAQKSGMEFDVSLGNTLLGMYAKFNCVESVQKVFAAMKGLDFVSWNTLIRTLACNGLRDEAWETFGVMRESGTNPNSHTIISVLPIFEDESCVDKVQAIHGFVVKHGVEVDPSLSTALTDIYMNNGDEAAARTLFEACPDRDVISWNAMIASYIRNNESNKALSLFSRMILEVAPDSVTIISILSSCTQDASLPLGQCLHAYATRRNFSFDLSLANAFISMYARSGSMQYAKRIFDSLPMRNIISWNALIIGYSMHGHGYDAIVMFQQMLEDGFKPNGSTFVAVLSACRHSGLIETGLKLFQTMVHDLEITPELVHHGCVVDLLCRAGRLNEAREFIESMPIEPDASVWRALLNGCRANSAVELAGEIFEKLVELEPMNAGNYVLVSNIYAEAGLWLEVRKIRTLLREKGLKKPPGTSWIVIKSQVHSFVASDTSHLDSNRIYACLNSLLALTKDIGYSPDLQWVLHEEDIQV